MQYNDKTKKLELRQKDRILFIGDSVTDARRDRENRQPSKPMAMGEGYAIAVAAELACKFPNMGFSFYNRGINGNKLFHLESRWQADCLDLKPTVISLLMGINDYALAYRDNKKGDPEQFDRDYRALLNRTLEALPRVRFILGEPFCFAGAREKIDQFIPDFYQYQPVVKKIAEDFGAAFIPYQEIYDKAIQRAPKLYYSSDGVHPALPGIHLMAKAWMDQVEVHA